MPNERQLPALEHLAVESAAPNIEELRQRCYERLVSGAEKYGTSWNEVNLKEDLSEELEDAVNYIAFMLARLVETKLLDVQTNNLLVQLRDMVEDVWAITQTLPDFEGPTSYEWVKANRA